MPASGIDRFFLSKHRRMPHAKTPSRKEKEKGVRHEWHLGMACVWGQSNSVFLPLRLGVFA